MIRTTMTIAAALFLAACGSEPDGRTSTKLDKVEVQPGTVSDAMILLDDARADGTAVDNSDPEAAAKSAASAAGNSTGDDAADEGSDDVTGDDEGETIAGSVAKKAPSEPSK